MWHGIKKQIGAWAKACSPSQTSKVHHVKAPLSTFRVPSRRFGHINVDSRTSSTLARFYLPRHHRDRFSLWHEAMPLSDTSASTCAQALVSHWISRFGLPSEISSDRGAQFTSKLWTTVSQLLGIKHSRTILYHPQANGLVERFHHHLKFALRARLTGPNWIDELPWVLLGICTAPKVDFGASSAELVYSAPLAVLDDFVAAPTSTASPNTFLRTLHGKVQSFMPVPTSQHGTQSSSIPSDLHSSQYVFVRRDCHRSPLERPYEGPFKVIHSGPKVFTIDRGGELETISIDRLKPAHPDFDMPV